MDFRPVTTPAEIKVISDLAYAIFPIDYGGYVRKKHIQFFLDQYQSVEAITEQLANNYTYFMLVIADEVAGYVGFEIEGKKLKLSKLYMTLEQRNQGLGQKTMEWLHAYAKNKGCQAIELLVLIENRNAIRFYERLEYRIAEMTEEHFKTGYSETNYRMVKNI